jgi:thiol:disulfide interchange protein DsbD
MPCVLPVLAIKAAGLAYTAHNANEARAHGLAYLAGVLICFAVVAAVIVALQATGQAVGVGFQLQYAPVVAFFALVMFALGLNLLGVYEMGSSLMNVGNNLASRSGPSGAFFGGLLAAFVGAPCVGPFMAVALGWALTQSPPVIIAMFLTIGLGLALPFVLLCFTPALAKVMPKPGKWMATFRQVLAFPMFATMLWLLWVVAGQAGADGVLLVTGGAILLGFGIWLATKIGKGVLGKVVAGLVVLFAFIAPPLGTAGIKAPVNGENSLAAEIGAEPWSAERVAELRAQGRVIFVDFTARWCVTCQVNKRVAIDSDSARKAFAEYNVAFLIADWTNQDSVIAKALAEHGRAGVPLYLVYPASGGEPAVLPQVLTPGLVAKAVADAAAGQRDAGAL